MIRVSTWRMEFPISYDISNDIIFSQWDNLIERHPSINKRHKRCVACSDWLESSHVDGRIKNGFLCISWLSVNIVCKSSVCLYVAVISDVIYGVVEECELAKSNRPHWRRNGWSCCRTILAMVFRITASGDSARLPVRLWVTPTMIARTMYRWSSSGDGHCRWCRWGWHCSWAI